MPASRSSRTTSRGRPPLWSAFFILNPEFDDIRLFYAIVLFRLDNYDEAKQQFNLVLSHAPPASLQAEADSYLSRIALRQQRTRFSASLSMGFHFDTNKNAAPASKRVLVFGGPSIVRGPQRDTGILAIANASFTHDLGLQGGHEVFGGVTFLQDRQTVLNNIDVQSYTASAGGIYHAPWFDVTPTASYTQLRIDKESYLRDYRLRLRFSKEFTPTLMGYIEPQFSHQKFQPIAESKAAHGRDGNLWGINFGGAYVLSPKQKLALNLNYEKKNAVFRFHGYTRKRVTATHTWLLGSGQFLISSGAAGIDLYNRNEPGVSPMTRRDETYRLRMIYGAPLNFFSQLAVDYTLPDQIGDIVFTLTGEQFWAVSNLNNYQYRNSKLQAMLTKKWNF